MVKAAGFDQLQRQIREAQLVLANFGDVIDGASFDPNDPGSIEAAILHMELEIDTRAGAYARNPTIAPMIEQMKEQYREAIIARAAAGRMGGEASE